MIVGDGCAGPPKPSICSGGVRLTDRLLGLFARVLRVDPRTPDAITKNPLSAAASHRAIIGGVCRTAQYPSRWRLGTAALANASVCQSNSLRAAGAIEHSRELARRLRQDSRLDDPRLSIVVIDESGREIHREPVHPDAAKLASPSTRSADNCTVAAGFHPARSGLPARREK
jgi:hypothetical protein